MSADLQRAMLLLEQQRFDLAEQELRRHLSQEPDDIHALYFLGRCCMGLDRSREALPLAEQIIGSAPDRSMGHELRGAALLQLGKITDARTAFEQALRFSPDDPDIYAGLALCDIHEKRWASAIEQAEMGLVCDPEHEDCATAHSFALSKSGKSDAADAGMQAILHNNPDSARAHATLGWSALQQHDHRAALKHFETALSIEPGLEWARDGLMLALKSNYFFFRWVMRWYMLAARLRGGAMFAIMIGVVFGRTFIAKLADQYPEWGYILWPIFWGSLGLILLTWVADPLVNALMRLHPAGRLALRREERQRNNIFVAAFVLFIACFVGYLCQVPMMASAALFSGALIIPVATAIQAMKPKAILAMAACCVALIIIASLALYHDYTIHTWLEALRPFLGPDGDNWLRPTSDLDAQATFDALIAKKSVMAEAMNTRSALYTYYIYGWVAFTWVGPGLRAKLDAV